MTTTSSVLDVPAPIAPRWTQRDRMTWQDLFTTYSELLITGTIEETTGLKAYPEEQLREDIKLAAEMADWGVQEMQYRFYKHQPESKQREQRESKRARRGRS